MGVFAANHDPVWPHKVVNGSAFLEEFRIRRDRERDIELACCQFVGNGLANPIRCADRDRAFINDDGRFNEMLADGLRHGEYMLQIGRTIFGRGSADRDENHLGRRDGRLRIGGELHTAIRTGTVDDGIQSGLINRNSPLAQAFYAAHIDIDQRDVVAHIGKTGASDKADIASTKNSQSHGRDPKEPRNRAGRNGKMTGVKLYRAGFSHSAGHSQNKHAAFGHYHYPRRGSPDRPGD